MPDADYDASPWTCVTHGVAGCEKCWPRVAPPADYDVATLEPWGPFEMGGFEGCTDQSPDLCACATARQPTCENCGQEIEPGEQAWARNWPCYNTLPLGHPDQEWDVISWHDECPDPRVVPPGGSDA